MEKNKCPSVRIPTLKWLNFQGEIPLNVSWVWTTNSIFNNVCWKENDKKKAFGPSKENNNKTL